MKKKIIFIFIFIGLIFIIAGFYLKFKFRDVTIETGDMVDVNDFIRIGSNNKVVLLTDLNKIDVNKIGTFDVELKYLGMKKIMKLNIVDTTPPVIKVKSISKPLNYQIDVKDFIVENIENATLEYETNAIVSKYGEYDVYIKAKDEVGNVSKVETKLNITWAKETLEIQIGDTLSREMLVYDKKDVDTISSEEIKKINSSGIGTYQINSIKNGVSKTITIIKIKDNIPPKLILKNIKTYLNHKVSKNDFIKEVSDNYSEVTTTLLTNIKYSLGKQIIKIEAVDRDGNKIVKDATLEFIKDTEGPVFSGLNKITIDKGKSIDFKKGVKAIDENYGNCTFEIKSDVDINKYGTYYVYYTSFDKEGNVTTKKRVVVVNHDENDTLDLIKEVSDTLPNDVIAIRDYVRKIKYSTNNGGSDPIWYGLKNRSGNCIVHAYVFDALLKAKGYETKIIWVTNKSHYWNMIFLNNKWVHMDSTPGVKHTKYDIMNDKIRYENLQGRDWDRSKWPKADWE